jgi:hypothetical protein
MSADKENTQMAKTEAASLPKLAVQVRKEIP